MPSNDFINEIDSFFSPYAGKRITKKQLERYAREYVAGWEFPTGYVYDGQAISLRILFRTESRYERPDIGLFPGVFDVLEFPHTEEESRLCVWDSFACCDHTNLEYLIALLEDAHTLVGKLLSGGCVDDFKSGFLSYWSYKKESDLRAISICDISNLGTRVVYLYKSKKLGLIFGDTEEQVRSWLINHFNYPRDPGKWTRAQGRTLSRIFPTALFSFAEAWVPDEYPKTINDLRNLTVPQLVTEYEFATLIGESLNNRHHNSMGVLLLFATDNDPCIAGLTMNKGVFSNKNKYSGSTILDGFRENIPYKHLLQRASQIKTLGLTVSRADDSWIHGRDHNFQLSELKAHKVIIIGCGSVGSSVASLLAKSGVRKLVLVDGDALEFANISRHELGADYVGKNKSTALRDELQKKFPHTDIMSFDMKWQDALYGEKRTQFIAQIESSDVIISATADWSSDTGLIDLQEKMELGPIVFSFTEGHAVAHHVLVHPSGSNAFQSVHVMNGENVGNLSVPCCIWESNTREKLPLCGGSFQPYGAVSISQLHTLTAETVIALITGDLPVIEMRKVWLGRKEQLDKVGGRWNPDWVKSYGEPNKHGCIVDLTLHHDGWKLGNV